MRLRPINTAFLGSVILTLVTTMSVVAQEDRQSDFEPANKEIIRSEPDPTLTESESRPAKNTNSTTVSKEIPKDTVFQVVKPVKPLKTTEKHSKEEDPLSFNFLYYIIEKFKLSDMIE